MSEDHLCECQWCTIKDCPKKRIDPIQPTEAFDKVFWEHNYPVGLFKDDQGNITYTNYMPRKERVYLAEEVIPKDEIKIFCENAIRKFKTAIKLFKAFQEKKIDHIYYWDEV